MACAWAVAPMGMEPVFRVNTDGSSFTNLHNFSALGSDVGGELEFGDEGPNSDGAFPRTTLTLVGTNLYGVAQDGGANGNGTVFRVSTDGSTFGVLHTFSASPNGITNSDGGNPFGNLVLSGNMLYGTTPDGGTLGNGIASMGFPWLIQRLRTCTHLGGRYFPGTCPGQTDGIEPGWGLVLAGGNLCGTAQNGGEGGFGTIFTVGTNGLGYETLYAFDDQTVGRSALCDLVALGTNLFGTTYFGGTNSNGCLFGVSINGANTFTKYYDFGALNGQNNNTGGANPYGGLVFAGTNLYGTAVKGGTISYGTVFQLTVPPATLASVLPVIQTDVQAPFYAYIGGTASNSVTATGANLAYQWQSNSVNLANGANLTGAQSNVLTLANVAGGATGNFRVIITGLGGSVTSSVAALTVVGGGPIGFNASSFDWTASQSGAYAGPVIANGQLVLTDGGGLEARSYFFDVPQYVGAFQAAFTYQDVSGSADGVAFVVQNDPRGASALGSDGGNLGVGGTGAITPSAELELNLYTGGTENVGYTFLTDGLTGINGTEGNYHPPGSVNLGGGNPINVTMHYGAGQLALDIGGHGGRHLIQHESERGQSDQHCGRHDGLHRVHRRGWRGCLRTDDRQFFVSQHTD